MSFQANLKPYQQFMPRN